MRKILSILTLIALAAASSAANAQQATSAEHNNDLGLPASAQGKTLTVGVKSAPPFVMIEGPNEYSGLSIDLWNAVASRLGLQTRFVRRNLEGLLTGLQNGTIDVAAAALTVTSDRESRLDFSFPFYSTGLTIATTEKRGNAWLSTLSRIFSWPFLTAIATLAAVLFIVGTAVWLFERRRNAEEFGGHFVHGLFSGLWWAAVTMTTVGYGDKAPRTLGGRLVGLVWMFAAIIIISGFTATIATSLTVGRLSSGITGVQDLSHARVATIAHSAASTALRERGISFRTTPDLATALKNLADHRVDAVVYDAPLLRYRVNQNYPNRIRVLDKTFERQDYAFALPQGSPLREPIDRAILEYLNTPGWTHQVKSYLGTE